MTPPVLISHSSADRETAAYLAGDLERQGVRAVLQPAGGGQAATDASAVILLLSHAGAASVDRHAEGAKAASAGKPVYVVRIGEVDAPALAGQHIAQWTDAFGPDAHANVARLAGSLRSIAGSPPAQPRWGAGSAPVGHGAAMAPRTGQSKWAMIGGAVVGVLLIVTGLIKIAAALGGGGSSSSSSSTAPAASYDSNLSGGSLNPSAPGPAGIGSLDKGEVASGGGKRVMAANDMSNDAISPAWMAGSWSTSCGAAEGRTMRFTPQTVFTGTFQSARGTGTYRLGGGTPLSISITVAGATVSGGIARTSPETMAIGLPGSPAQTLCWCGP
jgi:hypothetical protein